MGGGSKSLLGHLFVYVFYILRILAVFSNGVLFHAGNQWSYCFLLMVNFIFLCFLLNSAKVSSVCFLLVANYENISFCVVVSFTESHKNDIVAYLPHARTVGPQKPQNNRTVSQ
jgi:hypothetical protein